MKADAGGFVESKRKNFSECDSAFLPLTSILKKIIFDFGLLGLQKPNLEIDRLFKLHNFYVLIDSNNKV